LIVFVSATASGCGYNTLTTKHENVKAKWANVETNLQRRSDLLNNLIETAKLAGVQEQEVFGKIAEARSKLLNATQQAPQGEGGDKTPEQKQAVIDASNSFGGTVGRLLVLQEAYPQLRSNDIVVALEGAGGKLSSTISSPIQVHGVAKVSARRAPEIGEHNEEVLRQLGFNATEIDGLRASGAIPKAKGRAA